MVICGICSYENQPNAKFCSGCGNKVRRSCPQCEAPLKPFDVFCSQCGYSVLQRCCVCNQINPEDSKFCFSCGSLVKNQCLGCGYVNLPDQKFCGNCQRPLKSSVTGSPQMQSSPQLHSHTVSVPYEPPSSSEEALAITTKVDKPRGQVVQEVVPEFLNPPIAPVAVDSQPPPTPSRPLVSENTDQSVKRSELEDFPSLNAAKSSSMRNSEGVQEVKKTVLKTEA
ncbi:MAG: zinc ribbon domain-containing protein, partial [Cyanobacteria bacterium]|nr:zinc ribbon domain-containing protein [Cyanobacteriota bacterium]